VASAVQHPPKLGAVNTNEYFENEAMVLGRAAVSENAIINIEIKRTGKTYRAWTTITTPGRKDAWQGGVYGAKTPLEAFRGVNKRIAADLSPRKRGRKPTGYNCLTDLQYGLDTE
jgi:hypothetical protein